MRRTITVLSTSVLLLAPGAGNAQRVAGRNPDKVVPAPVSLERKGFEAAFSRVGTDLYIAGQPTKEALHQLRDRGVTTVVNLRTPEEMAHIGFDEAAEVAALGMKYVFLPVRGTPELPYSPATVDAFSQTLREAPGAVLLHCTIAWRASHLWSAYLIRERGMSVDSALQYGRLINLMDAHRMTAGRQPVEEFLNRDLEPLRRQRTP